MGNKFVTWNTEWNIILNRWEDGKFNGLPNAMPKFLGYVTQQHNVRTNKEGMTLGWQIFGRQVDSAVVDNIVNKLKPLGQVVERENYNLGAVPNLHSLIPYSLDAHKPVYKCTSSEGLKGAHINKAKESANYYQDIVDLILQL